MSLGDLVDKAKNMTKDKLGDAQEDPNDTNDQAGDSGNEARQSAQHDKLSSGDAMNNDPASGTVSLDEVD